MAGEFASFLGRMEAAAVAGRLALRVFEEGRVLAVGDGIAAVRGLRGAQLEELIELETGDKGIVFDLDTDHIGLVLLSGRERVRAGHAAFKTGEIASIRVGESLLGRVLDALGRPIDDGPEPAGTQAYPIERAAPALTARGFVERPLATGIKVIDAMLPIGRGQRELIIGDPSTGKSALAIDAVINQRDSDVLSVYAIVGQRKAQVLKIVEELKAHGEFSRTVVVAADAATTYGKQYVAPYAATAIAEYFRDRGRDVLIVYDDLTKHAEAHRALSLLLKRPPGREAYPGDIFYLHARLLERAAQLDAKHGGGSITALPIVETQQGRIAAYIPTNLISITDGQVYLDAALVGRGVRPAVDVGMSVSRIGAKAQTPAMRSVAQRLKIDYARFMEVESFRRFGARLEEQSAKLIRRGERLRELLRQPRFSPCPQEDQVLGFVVLESGALDALDIAAARTVCGGVVAALKDRLPEVERRIRTFSSIEDIVNAMKAYAGVTIKRTEEMVRSVRDYEEQVLRALAVASALDPEFFAAAERGARRVVVAFGSSQGLCGALNEHVADLLQAELRPGESNLIVGRRLQAAAAARGLALPDVRDSIVSVSGIRPAIEQTIAWILERYRGERVYAVEFVFTVVAGHEATVVRERILPPDAAALAKRRPRGLPPLVTLEVGELIGGALRELIAISLYRAFAESLRSENWHRMRVLEGATESLKRRVDELGSLRNYLRQEEITEEMLEILSSGGFYAR